MTSVLKVDNIQNSAGSKELKVVSGLPQKITRVQIDPKFMTGSSHIPRDNTLPVITDGGRLLQYDYTPILTTSTIIIEAFFHCGEVANVTNTACGALFLNDVCKNVRSVVGHRTGNGDGADIYLQAIFENTTGNSVDIEIRVDDINNFRINSQYLSTGSTDNYTDAGNSFGGANETNSTMMTITEIL